jgi:pimeloyl-ACP methyl ester carboxylesterase
LIKHILPVAGHKLVALDLTPGQCGHSFILIHGINASTSFWLSNPTFLKHGHCYALSLPGHYPAAFPPGFQEAQFTVEEMAKVMSEAICELAQAKPVTLVGHSTGGFAALAIAAYSPEMVQRVISIGGFVRGQLTGILGLCQNLLKFGAPGKALCKLGFRVLATNRSLFRQSLQTYAYDKKSFFAYADLNTFVDNSYSDYKHLHLDSIFLYLRVLPELDISDLLPRINQPVLALVGDCDPIVPPTQSEIIASSISNADLITLKGVGHVPFFECPAKYQQAVDSWLVKTNNR